jgi:hypothetical protein
MEPSRPLKLVVRDRARRNPASRPAYAPIQKLRAWSDAKLASTLDARPASADAEGASGPKRQRVARAFLIAMMVMVGVNFGAVVGWLGWGALQAVGVVAEPAIETVQRTQAALISQLDETVHALDAAVVGLGARADSAAGREEAANRRMAEIDGTLGVLRTSIDEIRAAQNAAEESWREPLAELKAAATRERGEIVRLRASLDDLSRARRPETVAIGARIDRIEQAMVQHNLLGPIRGSIQEPARRGSPASPESSPAADGHIINLTPAH